MYRFFDHTADVGLHIEAESLPTLFADAGRALMSLLVENPDAFEPAQTQRIELQDDRLDDLLFDYLSELLYRFSAHRFLPVRYDVDTDGRRLAATLAGQRFDPERHEGGIEVKAITYHNLRAERCNDHYRAEVIVDV